MQPSVFQTHVGNIPRNIVQSSANGYTKELASFLERTIQQYVNSIPGIYDPETKTDQVKLKRVLQQRRFFLFTML
jgi:hypothetical protein